MTDTAVIGMKKCGNCNQWKATTSFNASSDTADNLQNWCRRCHKKYKADRANTDAATAKALDVIPVLAITADGKQTRTTVAKALRLADPVAVAEDAERLAKQNAELDDRIPESIKRHVADLRSSDPTRRAQAQSVAAARSNHLSRAFTRIATATRSEMAKQRIVDRLDAAMVKQVQNERLQKARRKSAKANARKQAAEQQMAEANALVDGLTRRVATEQAALNEQLADISRRVEIVAGNAQRAYDSVQFNRQLQAATEFKRVENERNEWLFKASTTNDDVLRTYYMAKASGEELDDDE